MKVCDVCRGDKGVYTWPWGHRPTPVDPDVVGGSFDLCSNCLSLLKRGLPSLVAAAIDHAR